MQGQLPLDQVTQGLIQPGFEQRGWEHTTLSGLGHLQPPRATCSSISPNFISFSLSIGPCPTTAVPDKAPLWPPCRPPSDTGRLQCNLLFSGLNNFVSLSLQGVCSHPLCGRMGAHPSYGLALTVSCPPYVGNTRTVHSIPGGVSQKHRSYMSNEG